MVKLVYGLRRLSHLSREEFQTYWRENHGSLVRRTAGPVNGRRYVQIHTIDFQRPAGARQAIERPVTRGRELRNFLLAGGGK